MDFSNVTALGLITMFAVAAVSVGASYYFFWRDTSDWVSEKEPADQSPLYEGEMYFDEPEELVARTAKKWGLLAVTLEDDVIISNGVQVRLWTIRGTSNKVSKFLMDLEAQKSVG